LFRYVINNSRNPGFGISGYPSNHQYPHFTPSLTFGRQIIGPDNLNLQTTRFVRSSTNIYDNS
jgi:hypothetical protein